MTKECQDQEYQPQHAWLWLKSARIKNASLSMHGVRMLGSRLPACMAEEFQDGECQQA